MYVCCVNCQARHSHQGSGGFVDELCVQIICCMCVQKVLCVGVAEEGCVCWCLEV